jgi:PPIC-type PPIASE domain
MTIDTQGSLVEADWQPDATKTWLVIGLVGGLLAALYSVLTPDFSTQERIDVVASVNSRTISREKFLGHLQALSSDKREAITAQDADYVLERIIEEELLVQRGLEVGLADNDKRTRAAIIDAMINMTTANAEASKPSETELENFFDQHREYFSPTARLRVQQLVLGDSAQADEAYERLSGGEEFTVIKKKFGVSVALNLPNTLLPLVKLREYLGPSAVTMLQAQPAGFISTPINQGKHYQILWLQEKELGKSPALEDVREQVEAELVRRRGDKSLRDYLQWLKQRADVQYLSELPL